jgi:hypothetical protein
MGRFPGPMLVLREAQEMGRFSGPMLVLREALKWAVSLVASWGVPTSQ